MTTVDMNDDRTREYQQVVFLKAHIKACKIGMRPRPPMTKSKLMQRARELTGASFGARAYDEAIAALENRREALLVYIENGSA